jgi:TusA-related sulfurtransferase
VLIKQHVNALGLICPEPLLKTRVALNHVAIGECVEVLTSDESSVNDFHRLVELTEHKMMTFEKRNKRLSQNNIEQMNVNHEIEIHYRYVLKKGQ